MLLHETFRTWLVFLSQSKWVQIVVCYDQNLQKHKYLSTISMLLHKTFRTGFVFLSRENAMIKTYKNINISVGYQCFCTKPSEQGSFFWYQHQSKWVQIVVCYKQNLQKCKYLWTTILSQSNPLFWQNLALWVIFSQFGVKGITKSWKTQRIMGSYVEKPGKWPKLAILS